MVNYCPLGWAADKVSLFRLIVMTTQLLQQREARPFSVGIVRKKGWTEKRWNSGHEG